MKLSTQPFIAAAFAIALLALPCLSQGQTALQGYRVSPGDVLQVSVFGEDQLTGAYHVGPSGTIAMPLVGNLTVGGHTMDEVEDIIGTELRRMIRRPMVTVALDELASDRKVYASGEVQRPGPMVLPFGATVADALSSAGPLPTADLRAVRVTNSAYEPRLLDLSGLRSDRPVPVFEPLRYGDVIFVPPVEDRIAILGAVNQPGEVVVAAGTRVTVLDALGRLSGGLATTADRSSALILRAGEAPINVDLHRLLQEGDLSQNAELQAGDVLLVHEAGKISVLGEVHTPTTLEIGEPVTLLEALARAGSITPDADLRHAQVITPGGTIPVDLEGLLTRGEMEYNLTVNPGDVVLVPRAGPETVLVLGAVEKPGILDMRQTEQRDLLRLLTVAMPTELADLKRVYVFRETGRLTVDMAAVMEEGDLSENISLEPDDIVMVPKLDTVYVLGAAGAQGSVPLLPDLTLMDVVSRYGNYQAGNLNQVTVMRTGENGETEFIKRNMAGINRGIVPEDMALQEGDVVYIPFKSRGVSFGQVRDALLTVGSLLGILARF